MFDCDSSSVVRSLIGLFTFRSNPVSKVYQHRSLNGLLEVAWSTVKDSAAWELKPDPFPLLANGTGPNRTFAHWKFTNVYHHRWIYILRSPTVIRNTYQHNGVVCCFKLTLVSFFPGSFQINLNLEKNIEAVIVFYRILQRRCDVP